MAKTKVKEVEIETVAPAVAPAAVPGPTEKEKLLALYQTLKDLNVRSIGDLENLIARA